MLQLHMPYTNYGEGWYKIHAAIQWSTGFKSITIESVLMCSMSRQGNTTVVMHKEGHNTKMKSILDTECYRIIAANPTAYTEKKTSKKSNLLYKK